MSSSHLDNLDLVVESTDLGKRLDVFISEHAPGTSRSRIKLLIRDGQATVDGKTVKASFQLRPGQKINVRLSELDRLIPAEQQSEDIELDILYEDEQIVAINKPPGMVVHPAKGHWTGTLTAGLMHHFKSLSTVGGPNRPGIVHRLDRDTSGVILVAKTDLANLKLTRQFQRRSVEKKYLAVVSPPPDRDRDHIEAPIGAHPYQREKMAIRLENSKSRSASTFYEVVRRQGRLAVVAAFPKTGRTHQIRIHLAHIGSPIIADRLYSGRSSASEGWLNGGIDGGDVLIDRQALHAETISFDHPLSKNRISISAPVPDDFQAVIDFIDNRSKGPATR